MADDKFRSLPTVQGLDTAVRRFAARLANLECEFSGEDPDSQLAKLWESIEEMNLRVLFIMNTLPITQTISPIADQHGVIPKRKMSALEAYMQHGGREKLIAGIEAQAKAAADAEAADGGLKVEQYDEGLQAEEQTGAAPADKTRREAAEANAQGIAADSSSGEPTLVGNNSKTKH